MYGSTWYDSVSDNQINCYGFALNIDSILLPNGIGDHYSASQILSNVIVDLTNRGIGYRVLDSYNSPISSNEYRIGMRAYWNEDASQPYHKFHFIKQSDNRFWVQKNGLSPSTILCDGSYDPMDFIWVVYKNQYDIYVDVCYGPAVYFAIQIGSYARG